MKTYQTSHVGSKSLIAGSVNTEDEDTHYFHMIIIHYIIPISGLLRWHGKPSTDSFGSVNIAVLVTVNSWVIPAVSLQST